MNEYKYKGWVVRWGDNHGIAIDHEVCNMTLYTGETAELGWGHCPRCKVPLLHETMRHLMNAYNFLKAS